MTDLTLVDLAKKFQQFNETLHLQYPILELA